ncbi:MAG: LysE family transporter [Cytophagaceae bacterium]|nr:LysE family transporter [Cytophagaceae bacterium]MDW8455950.1 LysE family transporter [Cytophagaceae bacterium]
MLKPIAEGIFSGFILSCMIGPVFFGLLHTSLNHGFKKAIYFALGVASSDSFFIALSYLGVAEMLGNDTYEKSLNFLGGLLMLAFGLFYLLKAKPKLNDDSDEKVEKKFGHNAWLKGFILNSINPSVIFICLGIVTTANRLKVYNYFFPVYFLIALIATVFSMDVLKALLARQLSRYVNYTFLNRLNKILGTVLFLAGVGLLWKAFSGETFPLSL